MEDVFYRVDRWDNFRALMKEKFILDFRTIDDVFTGETNSYKWDSVSEEEIIEKLDELNKFEGVLYIITDASYQKELGPFIVKADVLEQFIEFHRKQFKEYFLETDVLIVNPIKRIIWAVHHEGIYMSNKF